MYIVAIKIFLLWSYVALLICPSLSLQEIANIIVDKTVVEVLMNNVASSLDGKECFVGGLLQRVSI